jgi:hypothetical protein
MTMRTKWLMAMVVPAAAVLAGTPEREPLRLDLPRWQKVSTPLPINLANYRPVTPGTRAPLMVPTGTVLLSRGAPVTSSDAYPVIGELPFVTDGVKEGSGETYVELGPGRQHVQIDLGKRAALRAIVVWHKHQDWVACKDVVVQVSDDPDFVTGVRTLFNNDDDNSSGLGIGRDPSYMEYNEGRLVDAGGAAARYVRLYSSGSTAGEFNDYTEVEVFGTPVQ